MTGVQGEKGAQPVTKAEGRKSVDAILVPGGGVRAGGELPLWSRRRLDRALERWQGEPIIALSAGTVHRPPPLDPAGYPIFESVAAARYLIERGVPASSVLVETCSYDTIGNAYFARVIHVDPRGFRRLLIITSDFHLSRTEAVFRWVFGLGARASRYRLVFEGVSDAGTPPEILAARREREAASLRSLRETQDRIATWDDFVSWLFGVHDCYAVAGSPRRVDGRLRDSY